jgi:hypothetical protein
VNWARPEARIAMPRDAAAEAAAMIDQKDEGEPPNAPCAGALRSWLD